METLKEKISAEYIEAFKNKNTIKKNLLGVVKGEITTQEKNAMIENLSDPEIIKILNKLAKGLRENIQSGDEGAKVELAIVESYLPKQMNESEVRVAISQVLTETGASNPSEMGKVMSAFNAKYAGQADGKTVSTIVKELLTSKP